MIGECYYISQQLELYKKAADTFEVRHADYFGDREGLDDFTRSTLQGYLDLCRERLGGPQTLVLKNPELSYHLAAVHHLLPAAKLVVVIRDPRDTIASILAVANRHRERGIHSKLTLMGRNMRKLAALYQSYHADLFAHLPALSDRLVLFRYESLMRQPETTIEELARSLGLTIESSDLVGEVDLGAPTAWLDAEKTADRPFLDAFRSPLHRMGISPSRVGAHKEQLSPAETLELQNALRGFNQLMPYW